MKIRLDKLLVERGLVPSRERAQSLILAGRVLVAEQKIEKSGAAVDSEAAVRLLGEEQRYVSRGGFKLEKALEHWGIDLAGRTCLEIGTSTGGFVDCMLQHGAARVIAVDTGYGQIAEKLRSDARIELRERTNARHMKAGDLPEGITFLAMDVSFISATLVLPGVLEAGLASCADGALFEAVILVKPQFEVGRVNIGKGGIVRDPEAHVFAVERVREALLELGAESVETIDSPILGAEGNREFLQYARFAGQGIERDGIG